MHLADLTARLGESESWAVVALALWLAMFLNGGAGDDQLTATLSARTLANVDYTNSIVANHLNGGDGNDVLTATVAPAAIIDGAPTSGPIGSSFPQRR